MDLAYCIVKGIHVLKCHKIFNKMSSYPKKHDMTRVSAFARYLNYIMTFQDITRNSTYVCISEQQHKPNITKQSSFCVHLE